MLKLKLTPEDFIVNEIAELNLSETGKYGIFSLQKRGLSTPEAISIIQTRFSLKPGKVGYGGNKDKRAVSFQFISIEGGNEKMEFEARGIKLVFLGFSDTPVTLGFHLGNQFVIRAYSDVPPVKRAWMPNYFGEQRFSSHNPEIGLALLKGNFKEAVKLIKASNADFAKTCQAHLAAHPNDVIGCLNLLPKKQLLMYVHAVQSQIFNLGLDAIIRKKCKKWREKEVAGLLLAFPSTKPRLQPLPLVGFASEGLPEEFECLMEKLGITPRNFLVDKLPWLSEEGGFREPIAEISKLRITQVSIGEYLLSFFLKKGCYATVAAAALF